MNLRLLISTIVLLPLLAKGQLNLEFGITQAPFYSSLGKFMNEEFLIPDGIKPIDKRNYYKYALSIGGVKQSKNNGFNKVQIILGHRHINEYYYSEFIDIGYKQTGREFTNYNQLMYVLNYVFEKKIEMNKIRFGIGIGGSLQRIGKGHQEYYKEFMEVSDNGSYDNYDIWDFKITTAGGWAFGLTGLISGEYQISERLSIGLDLQSYLSFLTFTEKDHIVGTFRTNSSVYSNSDTDVYSNNDFRRIAPSYLTPNFRISIQL
jgi:hypothetical protein